MNTEWDLTIFYQGLDDPAYSADAEACSASVAELHELVSSVPAEPDAAAVEKLLLCSEKQYRLFSKLINYLQLRQSVESTNGELMAQLSRMMRIYSESTADRTAMQKYFGRIPDIAALAAESDVIHEYAFLLEEEKKHCSHLLSDEAEAIISAMDMTGGDAWGNLQSYLTSTVTASFRGKDITLSEVRNLAYSDDAAERREAYEAELACYDRIADSVAFSLNNIKNQVSMLAAKRGYASPLALALEQSRMQQATLDAMMEAIREYLPSFRRYLKAKGKMLGYENGLPWFELFAPLGGEEKSFSLEECRDYLTGCFSTFSPEMADMMQRAFDQRWIDFYPRPGKVGGAFCSETSGCRQSRILTNYDGTFSAVDTLAHELGHAFHNQQLENERPLNSDYPMPVAETASTFNEVFLGEYALSRASDSEKLGLLESDLREKTQCIVDIYSRFLFESAVFEQSSEKFLMADDLKALMLQCQQDSYGDGLDPQFMHPYMWVCKSHYYSSGLSFYNFPYAFGNLFAQGLYALYKERGESFVADYKEMLRTTPVHQLEENGAVMGLDLTKKEFWQKGLASISEEIDEFCRLCGE